MVEPSSPLTDWIEESPPPSGSPRKQRPEDYVWPRWWFHPLVMGTTLALLAGIAVLARTSLMAGTIGALAGALVGLTATLIAHAWGVAIVFADSARRGFWFAVFPPYMVYYAVVRWQWMAQPTVLFLCGLVLAFGALFAVKAIAPGREGSPKLAVKEPVARSTAAGLHALRFAQMDARTSTPPVDQAAGRTLKGVENCNGESWGRAARLPQTHEISAASDGVNVYHEGGLSD